MHIFGEYHDGGEAVMRHSLRHNKCNCSGRHVSATPL